jgi:AAA family ATPase
MAGLQKSQEFKLRAIPSTRSDQKEVSRVMLSADVMYEMGLKAGQPCSLWKSDEPDSKPREALVFNVIGQKLNKDVIQIYRPFQEICGFKLEDRIAISAAEELETAHTVILQDISPGATSLTERDRPHWEWALEEKLS